MKRRTALKRVAAGAGSTLALAGTAASRSSSTDTEYGYRVTEDGIEEIGSEESVGTSGCSHYCCSKCSDYCEDGCECADPYC